MLPPDHYATLKISRTATTESIKIAYRQLAKQHHPDLNQNDPTAAMRFRRIVVAYELLSDAQKRAAYDLTLAEARLASSEVGERRASTTSSPPYQGTTSSYDMGGRIDRAIEVLGRLREMGGYETWRKEVHGWAYLHAQDEVYELQSALREHPIPGGYGNRNRDDMIRLLERFKHELLKWGVNDVLKSRDDIDQSNDYMDRLRVGFIYNPDVLEMRAGLEIAARNFLREQAAPGKKSVLFGMNDPHCATRVSFTLCETMHAAFTPALIKLTDLQMELGVLVIAASYAKRMWSGRWQLDPMAHPEYLFRAALAAKVVGVKTLGYEIPADRMAEVEWVIERMDYVGGAGEVAKAADSQWYSLAQRPYQAFELPGRQIHGSLGLVAVRDMARPMDRVRRFFGEKQGRYRHLWFARF